MAVAVVTDTTSYLPRGLAEGLYGTCVDCGKEIQAERLEAVPEAIRCIDDQRRYEAQLRARGGPPLSAS